MNALLATLFKILRWLFGALFVFSAVVKLMDPLGSAYKFQDYFEAMNLSSLSAYALFFSVALSVVELLIGVNLLAGIRLKATMFVTALFMAVMTPLTAWIAIANPVSDCGCFGDALVIGNWATFYKNIVLTLLLVVMFLLYRYHTSRLDPKTEWVLMGYTLVSALIFAHLNYYYLPMIDFRPYRIGTHLPDKMAIPPGAPTNEYSTTFILEKNGVRKSFSLANYPDSTWTFIAQQSKLIKKGFTPAIQDFAIHDDHMNDLTDSILHVKHYLFLVISDHLNQMETNHLKELKALHAYAQGYRYGFYLLTGSTDEVAAEFLSKADWRVPVLFADPITLKTVIRSNPGLVLLYDGTVVNKWSNAEFPSFAGPLHQNVLLEMPSIGRYWEAIGFMLLYIILFWVIRFWLNSKKKSNTSLNSFYHTTNYSIK
ncbi:MAG: BT_3928 family protein [Microbacter sp.]